MKLQRNQCHALNKHINMMYQEVMHMCVSWIVVLVTWVYAYVQTHQTVYISQVQFYYTSRKLGKTFQCHCEKIHTLQLIKHLQGYLHCEHLLPRKKCLTSMT